MWSWHPQRREILIGTRFADTDQVHSVTMPGGARNQLTFFGDRVSEASYQPHTGDYFLFRKDMGGGEWYQIFRFNVASGNTTLLTDGKSRNTEFVWSNQGDRMAYASTRRNNADLDFYVMNPADKASDKRIAENQGGGWQVRDWSPDDRTLAAVNGVSINESSLWLVDAATGQKTELTPKGADKVFYEPVGFSRDGKGCVCRHRQGQRVPATRLHGPGDQVVQVPDELQVGHRSRRRAPLVGPSLPRVRAE